MLDSIVSADWLNENLNHPNLVLLDASQEFISYKTIPNTLYFDLKNVFLDTSSNLPNTVPSPLSFQEECRQLGINDDSFIVVFDRKGIYTSPRVWWLFNYMGHSKIAVLNGGFMEWTEKGYATSDVVKRDFKLGNFTAKPNNEYLLSFNSIVANVNDKSFSLIDARSEGRFSGIEKEPREYLQSGNIPNSLNIPFTKVLERGRFKSKTELYQIFKSVCAVSEDVVFSCGSGITACIIMLACNIGFKESKKLYDGSWTEWAELNNLKKDSRDKT